MTIVSYFLDLLSSWGYLFIAPLKDFNMLWIIIPAYLNWIFTEFYQEKKGTSLGNAVSNGVVVLWIGIDFARQLVSQLTLKSLSISGFFLKFFIALLFFGYGLAIIVEGIKGRALTRFIGRIREVTYAILVLTPMFYGVVALNFKIIFATVLFFPIFYGVVELIDRITPNPKTYEEEEEYERKQKEKDRL